MKKSFKTIIVLSLVALAAASAFAKPKVKYRTVEQIKKSKTIKIAVFSDKKPFGYVDEYGKYQGYLLRLPGGRGRRLQAVYRPGRLFRQC